MIDSVLGEYGKKRQSGEEYFSIFLAIVSFIIKEKLFIIQRHPSNVLSKPVADGY